MSDDGKGSDGAADKSADGVVDDKSKKPNDEQDVLKGKDGSKGDTVAYETYKKTLALAKKREAELETERAEKQKLVEEKLQVEGKKDELIQSLNKKYSDLEGKFKKAVGSFATNTLSQAISLEATKDGCVDVKALLKLVELNSDMIDDEFNVHQDQVKELVERSKKEHAYLFPKNASAAKTGTPKKGEAETPADWKKLPLKEQAIMAFTGLKK